MIEKSLKNDFHSHLEEKIKGYPDIDNNVVGTDEFILLCQKFVDISLNAPRQVIQGTTEIQACFQYADIDAAGSAFKSFCEQFEVVEKERLLDFIQDISHWSVHHDSMTSGVIMNPDPKWGIGNFGVYYDFTQPSDDIWESIKKRILEPDNAT